MMFRNNVFLKITAKLLPMLMGVTLFLPGCQLMPEEEVLPVRPVVQHVEVESYTLDTVMRGDLVLTTQISCRYMPAKSEELSFSVGSQYIDRVYVEQGQRVEAGELLAQLQQNNLQEQISSVSYQLEMLKLQKSHLVESRDLDLEIYDTHLSNLEMQLSYVAEDQQQPLLIQKQQYQQQRAQVEEEYRSAINQLEDSIYLQYLQLDTLKTELKECQIIAGIDGTVTFVRDYKEGDRSVKGEKFITVSDLDTTAFIVTGEDTQYFTTGMEVSVVCQNQTYMATVTEPEELGVTPDEGQQIVYLKLQQPDPTLKEGDRGKVSYVLEQRKNVLYVNAAAVKTSDSESFVYVLDEEGMRTQRTVTVGIKVDEVIEIVRGLQEGDSVIID